MLLTMNTYDVFIVDLVFLGQKNDTLTSLMASLGHVQSDIITTVPATEHKLRNQNKTFLP